MIDFAEKIKECSLAFHFFIKSDFPKYTSIKEFYLMDNKIDIYIDTDYGSMVYYVRDLYEFFDKHHIYCTLDYKYGKQKRFVPKLFDMLNEATTSILVKDIYQIRIDAELDIFVEAFKILNKKILNKQVKLI